jgi:hypothetical protein
MDSDRRNSRRPVGTYVGTIQSGHISVGYVVAAPPVQHDYSAQPPQHAPPHLGPQHMPATTRLLQTRAPRPQSMQAAASVAATVQSVVSQATQQQTGAVQPDALTSEAAQQQSGTVYASTSAPMTTTTTSGYTVVISQPQQQTNVPAPTTGRRPAYHRQFVSVKQRLPPPSTAAQPVTLYASQMGGAQQQHTVYTARAQQPGACAHTHCGYIVR